MKPIPFYTYMFFNIIGTVPAKIKLGWMKKHSTQAEVDQFVDETVSNWARAVLNRLGIKVNLIGSENLPEENCVFIANHQGNFDFFLMMAYVDKPLGFIAKVEIEKYPIFSDWMREMHCVFMDRSNIRESVKAINDGVENLKKGYSMVIYPEGTRSRGHEIGEFKKGSLKLAIKGGVPIVPVTLEGSYKIYEENKGKDFKPTEITMIIDKPVYVDKLTKEQQKELPEYIKGIIKKNLDAMNL